MKQILLLTLTFCVMASSFGQNNVQSANLPNPKSQFEILESGSYVIAMDNTWQTNDDLNPSKRYFNLKAYGLVVYLLNNGVKLKRVIKAGKQMGDKDFSVASLLIRPTAEGSSINRDFKAGPFIINSIDLPENIDDLINTYNNTAAISGIVNSKYRVKVYKTLENTIVDVRYDMSGFKPKAGIMDDGGNVGIHTNYFVLAGVPASNYAVTFAANLTIKCFSFASEPHNSKVTSDIKQKITDFVKDGGNFLAQCEAIPTYENEMHFHTDKGLTVKNSAVVKVEYPNADLAYGQIEGAFGINNGGSCQNWALAAGSSFINNAYPVANGKTAAGTEVIGAGVSKITGNGLGGGIVFYLGSHSYSSITDYVDINGIRMYMNAFLTPPQDGVLMQYTHKSLPRKMRVNAPAGPTVGYPVKFKLYADKGQVLGVVDAGDIELGMATINGPGQNDKEIYISDQYVYYTPYVMTIEPSSDCVGPALTVQPAQTTVDVLSVVLSDFSAKRENSFVNLKWTTQTEQNNQGFVVQSKWDDGDWKDIAFIFSAAPGGNSSTVLNYSYNDLNANKGVTQYRLLQKDLNNNGRFSEIRTVMGAAGSDNENLILYPNPAKGGTATLLFDKRSERNIYITNVSGHIVKQWIKTNHTSLQINLLSPGLYIIRIDDLLKQTSRMEKLVVN